MSDIRELIGNSLQTELTWCESHRAQAYDSGWRTDPFLVVIIPLDETYFLLIADDDNKGKNIAINPGEMLIVPPGTRHALTADECTIRGINVKYRLFGGIDLLSFYQIPFKLDGAAVDTSLRLLNVLIKISGRRSAVYPVPRSDSTDEFELTNVVAERSLLLQLLLLILEHSEPASSAQQRIASLGKIQPALDLIHDNFLDPCSLAELANACGLSERHFRLVFKQAVGTPPHQYRLSKRIERAMAMLAMSNESITEIAERLNFFDQSHFTKTFKLQCGLSPRSYQKNLRRRFSKTQKGAHGKDQ